ncbi:hypothetical protein TWF106_011219 [Orbilia oligospora]|uniref:SCP domain-containing protein n=1 Tax=Orbilia oligospora TaxID=2813651 RepID=A0A7C8V7J8_ORBOL|nr:hypothetical protein TWF106_011219 [Orbilia oligospora]
MKVSVIISALAAGTAILAAPVEPQVEKPSSEEIQVGQPVEIKPTSFQFADSPDDITKRSAPPGNYYQQPYNPVSYRPPADTSSFLPESQYRDAMLRVHNNCREAHGVPALKWSQDLVNYAQSNTPTCAFAHSRSLGRDSIGENILYGPGSPESMVQTMWYENELRLYNFARQGFAMSTGHMTQMVWKATTEVGCAVKKCPQGTYVKCNYRRPGNVMGQFEGNVPPPRSAVKNVPSQNYNNYKAPAPKNTPAPKPKNTPAPRPKSTPAPKNNYNYNAPAPKNNYNSPAPKNNGYYQTNNNGYYQANKNNNGYYQTNNNNNGYYAPHNNGNARPNNSNNQNRRPTYTYTYTYRPSSNSNNQKPKPNTVNGQNRNTGNGGNRAQNKPAPQSYGSYYGKRSSADSKQEEA